MIQAARLARLERSKPRRPRSVVAAAAAQNAAEECARDQGCSLEPWTSVDAQKQDFSRTASLTYLFLRRAIQHQVVLFSLNDEINTIATATSVI
jgi:hypothetical protein